MSESQRGGRLGCASRDTSLVAKVVPFTGDGAPQMEFKQRPGAVWFAFRKLWLQKAEQRRPRKAGGGKLVERLSQGCDRSAAGR